MILLAFAQGTDELGPSTYDMIIIFSIVILSLTGIIIYITKDIIMRKKTDYDKGEFESQRDRDQEKYHSEWGDESVFDEKNTEYYKEQIKDSKLPDYYKILMVERNADIKEIKKQYRILAKKIHPDKNKTVSSKHMMQINKAYEILSDKEKKERYDRFLDLS